MTEHERRYMSASLEATSPYASQMLDRTQESTSSRASRLERYLSSARYDRNGRQEVDDDLSYELDQYTFPLPFNSSEVLHSSGVQLLTGNTSTTSNAPQHPPIADDRGLFLRDETFVSLPFFASPFPEHCSSLGSPNVRRTSDTGPSADVIQAWLDYHVEHPLRQKAIRRLLDMSYQNMNHLPTTLFITGVKMDAMASPVAGGSFADVYRGSYQGHDVAIKRIRVFLSNDDTNKLYKRFYREALIWRQLRHPHILAFMGIDQDALSGRGSLSMVSSWMTRGTLMQYLKRAGLSDAIDHHALITDIAAGLDYLHAQPIVHGDLHGSNIFINEHQRALLGDFGFTALAELSHLSPTISSSKIGSFRWLSPELLAHDDDTTPRKTKSSDIFAFGRIGLSVYTRHVPFHDIRSDIAVLVKVLKNQHPPRPRKVECYGVEMPDDMWELILRCWSADMAQRPVIQNVLLSINKMIS